MVRSGHKPYLPHSVDRPYDRWVAHVAQASGDDLLGAGARGASRRWGEHHFVHHIHDHLGQDRGLEGGVGATQAEPPHVTFHLRRQGGAELARHLPEPLRARPPRPSRPRSAAGGAAQSKWIRGLMIPSSLDPIMEKARSISPKPNSCVVIGVGSTLPVSISLKMLRILPLPPGHSPP